VTAPDLTVVDCAHRTQHQGHHRRHPVTGRLVCLVCHPPAAWLEKGASGFVLGRREGK
jgi:hypothetical protein